MAVYFVWARKARISQNRELVAVTKDRETAVKMANLASLSSSRSRWLFEIVSEDAEDGEKIVTA